MARAVPAQPAMRVAGSRGAPGRRKGRPCRPRAAPGL